MTNQALTEKIFPQSTNPGSQPFLNGVNPEGQVALNIDGISLYAPRGVTILEAARSIGIRIPTLCHHPDLCFTGVCRICLVEVEGQRTLQASCAYPVFSPIRVKTWSPAIRRARRNILSLMLRNHHGTCYACTKNTRCELQALCMEYGITDHAFGHQERPRYEKDLSSPVLVRDMDKCILCRRCVRTCMHMQGVGVLEVLGRGEESKIGTCFDLPMAASLCIHCGQCVNRCPTGALHEKSDTAEVWKALETPEKHVVIQTAPAPRVAIGEAFGCPPGVSLTHKLNTALKHMGFNKVFDTNFTADLTIMEEGTELLLRLKKRYADQDTRVKLPQLTSCSPGWIQYIESFHPSCLDYLSTAKSPQQMFGALIKTWYAEKMGLNPQHIVSVSLMPCTAKKFECERPEMRASGYKDVDFVLTTRELAAMIREGGMDLTLMEESSFDDPLGIGSGAGLIFGATGGVMEAAIRTAYEIVTGEEVPFSGLRVEPVRGMQGIRRAELPILKAKKPWKFLEGLSLKVMVAHGISQARQILAMLSRGELEDVHFIEVMACPGGCLGGGGQPIPTSPEIREARARALYQEEENLALRKSHENPVVQAIYKEFLTDGPCGCLSHKLLHTTYGKREPQAETSAPGKA
ncbi:NADH-dependent [FeFe] hydrogenase, group A6 [Desulfobotulus sp.]|jgi:NADH-quinone oxidoreductase subunit G/[NiFe] hydrogenase diaphorase moiety small subunit|uniref:NADH-dependent [FeFe] hydrogenase, group A6 n=1 Tax=Desulfobotulus sp. TaxID=1940337 RepID=UPI002A35AB67|nr:NADH-dependent [FeFe] hydrogenase, group A6 [Desulfobotulus sp.]MDY0163834.1 NADH-dependent [FeFe] hydrogenase, group A6 [Desulfobotulus sp.]